MDERDIRIAQLEAQVQELTRERDELAVIVFSKLRGEGDVSPDVSPGAVDVGPYDRRSHSERSVVSHAQMRELLSKVNDAKRSELLQSFNLGLKT